MKHQNVNAVRYWTVIEILFELSCVGEGLSIPVIHARIASMAKVRKQPKLSVSQLRRIANDMVDAGMLYRVGRKYAVSNSYRMVV